MRKPFEHLLKEKGLEPGEQVYATVMLSFSNDESYGKLKSRLAEIHPRLPTEVVDEEYVILYPRVIELLKKRRLNPLIAYTPDGIPRTMI